MDTSKKEANLLDVVDHVSIDIPADGSQHSHDIVDTFALVELGLRPKSCPDGQPPPAGYYQQPPPGIYNQPPQSVYYSAPPPQDVGRQGPVYIDHRPPPPPPTGGSQPPYGESHNEPYNLAFDDARIRSAFIRKVYAILSVQLAYTTAVIAIFVFVEPVRDFVRHNILLLLPFVVIELVTYIALVCCTNLRRTVPLNAVLLGIFTIAMAYIVGTISAFYGTKVVLFTFAITCVVCILVTVIAMFSCVDITGCGAVLCILSLVVFVFGIFAIVLGLILHTPILYLIYSGVAAMLFCAYLMYDTQLIMGGRSVELSPEEYILGAICLYTDIVQLYMMLLPLIGCFLGDD